MGLGAEAFTVLAVLEARDMASEIYDRVQRKLGELSGSMKGAADAAEVSGAKIDESFMATASGADALSVATAKVEAASGKVAAATRAQADAEKMLLDAQAQAAAAADGDAKAMDGQIAASDALTEAQKRTAKATKELRDAQATQAAITDTQKKSTEDAAVATETSGGKLGAAAGAMGKVGLGVAIAGGFMVKGAADFQSSTTVLQTSGGEVASQMDSVRKGILGLSGSTGTALKPLTDGMYMIGSAGYTGGSGLRVLQSAAQGAKAENADLGTVSNALTTILKDYNVQVADNAKGQQASNAVMNQMIAVVQNGKTTTEQLAGSLSNVLPIASSVGLGFDQIGGAMATITGQGMSAQQSAQDLNNVIGNLAGGNAVAAKEMQSLGLNANDVRKALGTTGQGLTGALGMVNDAISKNFVGGAQVVKTFQSSASAAQNASAMISKMPSSLQALAKSYMDGSVSAKDWKKDLQGLDPISAHLMQQFAGVADQTHAFNDQLLHGTPAQQSASQALSKMLGGTTGLNVALMLGANKGQTFADNVKKVGDAAKGAGSDVEGWKEIQGNFNQKLTEAKDTVEATGIRIGTALLPMVTRLAQDILAVVGPIAEWVSKHQHLTEIILVSVAGIGLLVGTINLAAKAFGAVRKAVEAVGAVVKGVAKLFGLFSASTDTAAASAAGAAASTDGLAASEDAAAASTDAATVSADASSTSWLRNGVVAVGTAAKWLAVKSVQLAITVATKAWTAAQWLFNAAMDANPITLVVLAIAALAAGVIYAYTHFQAFRDVVQAAWDWLKGAVVAVIDFVKEHWQLIVEIIVGPIAIVAFQIQKHWGDIKRWFSDGVHDVESILSWFGSLPGRFASWLSSAASSVARGLASLLGWWIELPGKVTSAIFGFFGGIGDKFAGWIGSAATSVGNKGADVLKWFTDLPGKITTAVSNFGSLLYQAGKDLVQGLINGVGNMASSAIDSVKNLGGSMVHGISSVLGIGSPSRVMADEVGKFIPAGIAAGIAENVDVLRNALTGAATLSVTTAQSSLSQSTMTQLPALPAIGASASGAGGTTIVQNFDFKGAHIMNERDMDQLVSKVGRAVATRILPAGGMHVAM